eukprot:gene26405-31906_t
MERNNEEAFAAHFLNSSVQLHLSNLKAVLQVLLNRSLILDYEFKHEFVDSLSRSLVDSESRKDQCSQECYRNCSHYPLLQASMNSKHYSRFIERILLDRSINIDTTLPFGSAFSLQFLDSLKLLKEEEKNKISNLRKNAFSNAPLPDDSENADTIPILDSYPELSIQSGGGSGWGFQMFCDGLLVMSTGAGGGGGFTLYAPNRTLCLGGGGGGGLQLFSTSHNATSLLWSGGGGGGCGMSDGRNIQCGFTTDTSNPGTNASSTADLDDALNVLSPNSLQQCKDITISGGGGGGGGTGGCCWPFHIGYGYSFKISPISSNDLSEDSNDPTSSSEKGSDWDGWRRLWAEIEYGISDSGGNLDNYDPMDSSTSSYSAGSSEDARYSYDVVGRVLHEMAAQYCGNSFTNWCCVSTHSQLAISECLAQRSNGSTATSGTTIDCLFLLDHYDQISWLVQLPSPACSTDGTDAVAVEKYNLTNFAIPNYFDYQYSADNLTSSNVVDASQYYSVYMNANENYLNVDLNKSMHAMENISEAWHCVDSSLYGNRGPETLLFASNSSVIWHFWHFNMFFIVSIFGVFYLLCKLWHCLYLSSLGKFEEDYCRATPEERMSLLHSVEFSNENYASMR